MTGTTRTLVRLFMHWIAIAGLSSAAAAADQATPPAKEPMKAIDARTAASQMSPGTNIGNTLENTATWETGWGNPPITKQYVQTLRRLGFKSVRLPVAWDTYADKGQITPEQFRRVAEVVNWITDADMYCVLNIHWDGGWINSGWKEKWPDKYYTFTPEAETKLKSYWEQIARFFAGKNEKLIFEGFSEEPFDREPKPYEAHTRVGQLFIDTVRATGGNNATRLLMVPGYCTDIDKTCRPEFQLPKDAVPGKLLLSIHYYTPWQFVGLSEDAAWGKMISTWGSEEDVKLLNDLFDRLSVYCVRNDIPAYIGEFSMCSKKERASSIRWTNAVYSAALNRNMVPVLWDTGGHVSRRAPYTPTPELMEMLSINKQPAASGAK